MTEPSTTSAPADAPAPPAPAGVVFEDVSVTFTTTTGQRVEALKHVDLTIGSGELVAVVGRSGCGKTTLLNVLAGLVAPTGGTVTNAGNPVVKPGRDRGVVFQADAVFGWKKASANVDFSLKLGKVPAKERRTRVAELLELVNLAPYASLLPREMSGGMRKRLAIAMVLGADPATLLLDEPFGPLDFATKVELQLELERIRGLRPITTLFVTHDSDEATFLADRVIVMDAGRIVDDIAVPLAHPRALEVRKDPVFAGTSEWILERILSLGATPAAEDRS